VARPLVLLRDPSPALARCELQHLERRPIDLERARRQHRAYGAVLERLGFAPRTLPGEERFPDCVFIEDTAVVLPELAVLARPGAASRRGEVAAVAEALGGLRPLGRIAAPGTLDGGDVLRLGRRLCVGRSRRTNAQGIAQLRDLVAPHGYEVVAVGIRGCLHLKSAVTAVAEGLLLANPDWLDLEPFAGWSLLAVDPAEPFAANALLAGGRLLYPDAHPRTRRRLEAAGVEVETVEVSELAKAEGSVTCCALLVGEASAA
jgi:dimethylargininase